jgi:small conductance mechanosensitive channel
MLSRAIDWIIGGPVAAIILVTIGAILNHWLRKAVTALINRLTTTPTIAVGALEMVGLTPSGRDPREEARAATLCTVARATVSTLLWTFVTLLVLGLFNLDLAPLIAGAGIAGIAVGFGAQSLVKDCIAGFFILLEDWCGVGDEVDVGQANGTVESLTLRMIRVRGADGTLWNIPNGAIVRIGNKNRNWSQGTLDIPVAEDADLDRAMVVMQEAAREACAAPEIAEVMLQEPRILGVERIDVESTVVRLAVRTQPGQQWPVLRQIRLAVKHALDMEGIAYQPPTTPANPPPPSN